MNFLFPLFLISGLAIAIPIIIHLFNFRKYKTIYFPDTRLLESIKITSQRSATIENWLLLLSRILFVAALVLAFAQPLFKNASAGKSNLNILYVDNSQSMSISSNKGQLSLLQKAVSDAKKVVEQSNATQDFILLTNDNPYASRPVPQTEVLKKLDALQISARTTSLSQVVTAVNNILSDNNITNADAYLFSDMQRSTLLRDAAVKATSGARFHFRTVELDEHNNIYFDTAYFLQPVIDTRQENPLVVKVARSGSADKDQQVSMQVLVDNQVRAAKTIAVPNDSTVLDTIPLVINTPGWHKIALVLKDAQVNYDDTFRITAKTNATLSVLNLTEGSSSPYITAALSPMNGFLTQQGMISAISTQDLSAYNLVILHHISGMDAATAKAIQSGLDNGLSFLIIPKNIRDIQAFNTQLNTLAPISLAKEDTTATQIGSVQSEHALLKDVIASMPANVQLPAVLRHYPISAGLNAGQQSILSLKNGHPFLAQYTIGQGRLYLLASPLEEQAGNFVLSNLFLPILYKMCAQSGAQSIYAVTANNSQPVFVPLHSRNRSVFRILGGGQETVPPQAPFGNGTNVYAGNVITQTGFYRLSNDEVKDSTLIAVNNDILESRLKPATEAEISNLLKPATVYWNEHKGPGFSGGKTGSVDLWKWCVVLALISLCIETYLLTARRKHKKIAL
ncbi:BatA domain-containing protein [Edaphocola aurantiacus]|uniref:BatA domain-containing protein n=1 Tax=Edaphocola aurantiacus TaxID=2601682 RepID=UPI001C93E4AC|nr:BatA domain-containing protein [Edaphocola aurantiacus]